MTIRRGRGGRGEVGELYANGTDQLHPREEWYILAKPGRTAKDFHFSNLQIIKPRTRLSEGFPAQLQGQMPVPVHVLVAGWCP